jgi:hypothetical protein
MGALVVVREETLADMVMGAVERSRSAIERRLTEIQTELDGIGTTFGMQWDRVRLNREKNDLLDQLLGLRCLA